MVERTTKEAMLPNGLIDQVFSVLPLATTQSDTTVIALSRGLIAARKTPFNPEARNQYAIAILATRDTVLDANYLNNKIVDIGAIIGNRLDRKASMARSSLRKRGTQIDIPALFYHEHQQGEGANEIYRGVEVRLMPDVRLARLVDFYNQAVEAGKVEIIEELYELNGSVPSTVLDIENLIAKYPIGDQRLEEAWMSKHPLGSVDKYDLINELAKIKSLK